MKRYIDLYESSRIPANKIYEPSCLSDEDIIGLHNAFLTPGFQEITVNTIQDGRSLVHTILKSLTWHQICAVLTLDTTIKLDSSIISIYQQLTADSTILVQQAIENFFLNYMLLDCIWIESTSNLESQYWFKDFKRHLINLKLEKQIPIICLFYTQ